MASNDDYAATADRMMQDARVLERGGCYRNACYLAGYVAECTLKALLNVATQKKHKSHDLQSLHDLVGALVVSGNQLTSRYGNPALLAPTMLQQVDLPTTLKSGQIVNHCHWDPEHRYDGARWGSAQTCKNYLREAEVIHDVIVQMTIDGVL